MNATAVAKSRTQTTEDPEGNGGILSFASSIAKSWDKGDLRLTLSIRGNVHKHEHYI